jgi:hypothetical protein
MIDFPIADLLNDDQSVGVEETILSVWFEVSVLRARSERSAMLTIAWSNSSGWHADIRSSDYAAFHRDVLIVVFPHVRLLTADYTYRRPTLEHQPLGFSAA